jgi:hypothetical protein
VPEYHPTIGDAIGYAMDHNARLAARIASERAAEDAKRSRDCDKGAVPGEPAEAQD